MVQNLFVTDKYREGLAQVYKFRRSEVPELFDNKKLKYDAIMLKYDANEDATQIELNPTLIELSMSLIENLFLPHILSTFSYINSTRTDRLSTRILNVLSKSARGLTLTQLWDKAHRPDMFEIKRALDTLFSVGVIITWQELRGSNYTAVYGLKKKKEGKKDV
jgi:hypothetical protein